MLEGFSEKKIPIQYRGRFVLRLAGLEKRLPRNFSDMTTEEIIRNQSNAENAIKEIFLLSIPDFITCIDCDGGRSILGKTIEGLVQYQEDIRKYLDSLKE